VNADTRNLSPHALVLAERAAALVPTLRERAAQATAERRVPQATMDAFRATDIMRVLQPRRFGGAQAEYVEFSTIIETIAQGCGSSAWVYGIFGEHSWVVAQFALEAQEEVWGKDPYAVACASFVPAGRAEVAPGGFRVSGKFRYASGCDHAQWAILGSPVMSADGTPPVVHDFLVPRELLTIEDDWHVLGLAGTGSKTLIADNVFVPMHRAIVHSELLRGCAAGHAVHPDFALTRAPRSMFAAFTLVSTLLGLARRAVDVFTEDLNARTSRGVRLAEVESIQLKLAESAMEADAARLIIRTTCAENQAMLTTHPEIPVERVALTRRNIAYATKLSRSAIERLFNASGGANYESSPLQAIYRDAIAASGHQFLAWELSAAPYARLRLGLPHGSPYL
jgi:alkylation response protein AidB-like acyl-CoA dehydrogenase